MEYVRNLLEVTVKQKIIHCIIDNDLSLHLLKYTNRFILIFILFYIYITYDC